MYKDIDIFIRKARKKLKPYSHLGGDWHQYHVTDDPSIGSEPFWIHNKESLQIKRNKVEGTCKNDPNPRATLTYTISGRIEKGIYGKMHLDYNCHEDPTDSLRVMYPNLLSDKNLAGIWMGHDFAKDPFAGPIILSRKELTVEELNRTVENYNINFVRKASKLINEIEEQEIGGNVEDFEKPPKTSENFTKVYTEESLTKSKSISSIEEEKKKHRVKTEKIAKVELEWPRVAVVQLEYSVESNRYPTFSCNLREEYIEDIKEKIFSALSLAAKEEVNIICFPELSFVKEWIAEIRKKYNKMVVICGSYYEDGFNRCPIIIDGELFIYNKINPSPSENPVQFGFGMKSGEVIFKFVTKYGKFSVLLCIDHRFLFYEVRDVDFVLNPSYDYNILRFQDLASLEARDFGAYTIQANAMDSVKKEKFGHSCIIGNEYEGSLKKLKDIGYIPKEDSIEYKLCEAKGEMMIIADINIKTRSPPRKTPPDYKGRIRAIKEYIWQGEKWEIIDRIQRQIKREE